MDAILPRSTYLNSDDAPEYEHVRPHPPLGGTAETPEQGYVGKNVIHTNFETATGDWTSEYGPSPKPKFVYIPPPPAPAPPAPRPLPPSPPKSGATRCGTTLGMAAVAV